MSEIDILTKLRYSIDMHLLIEEDKDRLKPQAVRLYELAKDYKKIGYLKDAICEIKRALQITNDEKYETLVAEWEKELGVCQKRCPYGCGYIFEDISDICPKCKRLIKICSECMYPNRLFDPFCRWCGKKIVTVCNFSNHIENFIHSWFYPLSFETLSPPPVIVGDLVVLPVLNEGSILALKVANGEKVWKIENIFPSNEYVNLLFVYPYLYVYNSRIIKRILMELNKINSETIYNDSNNFLPSFPVVNVKSHKIYFPVNKGLFVHDTWRSLIKGKIYQTEVKKDEILFPVMVGEKVFAFSTKGKIYKLSSHKMEIYSAICDYEHISPPIANRKWIYFEGYSKGRRTINAWSDEIKNPLSLSLPDLICSIDDIHFHHPPYLYKDGVLLISCEEAKLYYVKVVENKLDMKEININISIGGRKVVNIEFLFSTITLSSYFISRVPEGFFYINLEDPTNKGMEFFRGEIMSKPLIFKNRLILLCKDGIRCYTFK